MSDEPQVILEQICPDDIEQDMRAQLRESLNEDAIADYAAAFRKGDEFPPVICYRKDGKTWLADGFHRVAAALDAKIETIPALIHEGTLRDAILCAAGVNAKNGLHRTRADKQKAIRTLLEDPEWHVWNDSEIARQCCVSPHTVATVRKSIFANAEIDQKRKVTRNGTTYEMQTANIGKTKNEPTSTAEESRPADDGDDAEDAGVELPDIGEVKLVPTGFVKNYVNDEDEGDEETHESFSGINRLGDFYDSLFSRLKPILADRNNGELLTIQGHLEIALEQVNDLIEQLEAEKDK